MRSYSVQSQACLTFVNDAHATGYLSSPCESRQKKYDDVVQFASGKLPSYDLHNHPPSSLPSSSGLLRITLSAWPRAPRASIHALASLMLTCLLLSHLLNGKRKEEVTGISKAT